MLNPSDILENALYLLALLNPASKVMFLAAYEPPLSPFSSRRGPTNWNVSATISVT